MKRLKLITIWLAAMAFIWLGISMASAAPPPNDNFDSATVIPDIPFEDRLNTSEATTAEDDPFCAGRSATVWYRFAPAVDMEIEANTFGSDYDTTLSVYTGTRGDLTQIACNDDAVGTLQSRVRFEALAGETYFFMVGAFSDEGQGGNLVFSVNVAPPLPPPLEIEVSVNRFGSFDPRTGTAIIQGTVTCSRRTSVSLFGELIQRATRFAIARGFFSDFFECEGRTPWIASVESFNVPFGGGPAKVNVFVDTFDEERDEFIFEQSSATVRLRGSSPRR